MGIRRIKRKKEKLMSGGNKCYFEWIEREGMKTRLRQEKIKT